MWPINCKCPTLNCQWKFHNSSNVTHSILDFSILLQICNTIMIQSTLINQHKKLYVCNFFKFESSLKLFMPNFKKKHESFHYLIAIIPKFTQVYIVKIFNQSPHPSYLFNLSSYVTCPFTSLHFWYHKKNTHWIEQVHIIANFE
jgi:hypothetical protein